MSKYDEKEKVLPEIKLPFGVQDQIANYVRMSKRSVFDAIHGFSDTENALRIREIALKKFRGRLEGEDNSPVDTLFVVKIIKHDGKEKNIAACTIQADAMDIMSELAERSSREGFVVTIEQFKDGVVAF